MVKACSIAEADEVVIFPKSRWGEREKVTASFRGIDAVNAVNIMAESMLCATRPMVFR